MSTNSRGADQVAADLFRRLDPGGELGEILRAFSPLLASRAGRGFPRLLKMDSEEVKRLTRESNELVGGMAQAILTFTPSG